MNPPLDLQQVVTDWLRNEASASGSDRVLAAALGRVSTVRQERRRPIWMWPEMGPGGKLAIAAAAVAVMVIAVASFDVLDPRLGDQGGTTGALPSLSPTPATSGYPPGFEIPPAERQSLTVDGVPFSFTVPTEGWMPGIQRKASDGTFKPGSLYIAKGTAGGQRAEAVVFWTAYPGGVNTGPCHNLLTQPIGQSAADLAAVLSRAPGTNLALGPIDVTLGGRDAKHVALTVREHLGCDPGYFFTWPDECWGACWIKTQVGDTIMVWVVDVGGKRLVIEAETTRQGVWVLDADATPRFVEETTDYTDEELQREVQQIVESIRFE